MSTQVLLMAEGCGESPMEGLRQAKEEILSYAARFTRFSDDSELAALNRQAGAWQVVAPDLFALLLECRYFYQMTEGHFDPAVLPDLLRLGYDRSIEVVQQNGAGSILDKRSFSPVRAPFSEVEFDEANRRIRLPAGLQVDLGGIAKGWIAGQAAGRLAEFSPACAVDIGGDMVLCGLPEGASAWEIGLEDPLRPDQTLAVLRTGPGAIATSSVAKRRWLQGKTARHHLIDPRTGQPAITDWLSVTAIAPSPTAAEVLAKALLIAGSGRADRLAREAAGQGLLVTYLGVKTDGTLWGGQAGAGLQAAQDFLEVGYDGIFARE